MKAHFQQIIALVRQEADIRSGKIPMEIDDESEDDGDVIGSGEYMSRAELLKLCAKLEGACIGAFSERALRFPGGVATRGDNECEADYVGGCMEDHYIGAQ